MRMVTAAELAQLLEADSFSGWFLTVLGAARVAFAQFTQEIY
ncbi:isopentenyl-diphosphate Delta-isomerase domain protein [Mycobacterium ulcerans str. Harvey]|uniref:Isopentenyl-diphosphate Delta-isomerase domain protein n=1 Tax=Mycobacterium ulcerans str. Harvey TaxID=1299332 RepID=A0ABP3AAM9_MYCUL|nr:isopentenyl-diphosphate Delta-isomerase domain protein [Mycobacterium ulcerans str. Harvey]